MLEGNEFEEDLNLANEASLDGHILYVGHGKLDV